MMKGEFFQMKCILRTSLPVVEVGKYINNTIVYWYGTFPE